MAVHINQIPQQIKDRLGLIDTAYKQFWAKVGNKEPIFFRSEWEFFYSIFLEKLKSEGKIKEWLHEPKVFYFKNIKKGTRAYLPDFLVIHNNGDEEWVETKGLMDVRSVTRLNRLRKYYPEVKIRIVSKEWFKQNLKDCKKIENHFAVRMV